MVIVAAACVLVPIGLTIRNALEYQSRAGHFASLERLYVDLIRHNERMLAVGSRAAKNRAAMRERLDELKTRLAFDTLMRRKYERATRYPWLPVPPDPPEPK
jgi:hypothetical protein